MFCFRWWPPYIVNSCNTVKLKVKCGHFNDLPCRTVRLRVFLLLLEALLSGASVSPVTRSLFLFRLRLQLVSLAVSLFCFFAWLCFLLCRSVSCDTVNWYPASGPERMLTASVREEAHSSQTIEAVILRSVAFLCPAILAGVFGFFD